MAYTTLVAGTTITAAWANASVRDQTVSTFASSAARTSAVTSPVEGMVSHLADVNTLGVYSGAAWSTIGPVHGELTSWTPTVTQSGSVTVTINDSRYQRIGRQVLAKAKLTVTGSGTSSNAIVIGGLPVAGTTGHACGQGRWVDASVSSAFSGFAFLASGTTLNIYGGTGTAEFNALGAAGSANTAGLASGDVIDLVLQYEAAGDA